MKYTERQLAEAIERLMKTIQEIDPEHAEEYLDRDEKEFEVIGHIRFYGPYGPLGLGLGRFGGHAVGEDD